MSHRAILLAASTATALTTSTTLAAVWVPTTSGTRSWNLDTNWSSPATFPNASGALADLNIDITGNQTVNLNTPITVGELRLGDSSGTSTYTIATNTLTFDSGTSSPAILINSGGSNTISSNVALGSALNVQANSGLTISGVISGSGALTKTGSGTLSLSNTNTFTGAASFTGGTLNISASSARPLGSAASVAFSDIAVNFGTIPNDTPQRINNSAPITLSSASLTLSSDGSNNRTEGLGALTLAGGDNRLTHTGGGSGTNPSVIGAFSFGTTTRVAGSTFTLANNDDKAYINTATTPATGDPLFRVASSSGAANLNQNGLVPWALANPQLAAGGFAFYTTNGYDEYAAYTAGPIGNTPTANFKVASTTESLAADSQINSLLIDTQAGAYTLGDGVGSSLTIGTAQSGATIGNPNFAAVGAILSRGDLATPTNPTTADISVSSLIFTGEALIFTEGANHTLTIDSPITGTGGLTKSRAGTLVLAGDNDNLDGPVRVNAGKLTVDGSLAHANIDILAGATLDGTGSIQWNIAGDVAELVTVEGTFSIGGLDLVLNVTGTQTGTEYVIANYATGTLSGGAFANVLGLPGGWVIDYDGTPSNPGSIVAVVPEPATLGAIALAGLLLVRRRAAC